MGLSRGDMAYFIYVGEKERLSNVYGYTFEGKKPVEVKEELFISKLENNSHFKKVNKPKKEKVVEDVKDIN